MTSLIFFLSARDRTITKMIFFFYRLVAATKKDTNGLSVLRLGDSNTGLALFSLTQLNS